jgi:hypothetical protein
VTLTRGFWFADLESGDGFGGRAAGLGQQLVAVVDAEGMVGGLDGQGSSSVDDSCNASSGVRHGRHRQGRAHIHYAPAAGSKSRSSGRVKPGGIHAIWNI